MAWQIVVPMLLAGLVLIGAIYLLVVGTFQSNGDVQRWAAISTIWLTIPVMIGALVLLVVVIALAYLIGRVAGFIPPYSLQAQLFTTKMAAAARRAGQISHRPRLLVPEIGNLVKTALRKIRGG